VWVFAGGIKAALITWFIHKKAGPDKSTKMSYQANTTELATTEIGFQSINLKYRDTEVFVTHI